jgi:hypothetical protein
MYRHAYAAYEHVCRVYIQVSRSRREPTHMYIEYMYMYIYIYIHIYIYIYIYIYIDTYKCVYALDTFICINVSMR